ncbi:hypothetical protein LIER_23329 [Lithospermum erythrorhizon]|uniref:Uncharacterized protein n=1 Tax=Lithospermum erythrorhizon TaxID=34254 RepID=A0AAV3R0Q9_LITER
MTSIKAQVLADFMVECTHGPAEATPELINLIEDSLEPRGIGARNSAMVPRGQQDQDTCEGSGNWPNFFTLVTWRMFPGRGIRRQVGYLSCHCGVRDAPGGHDGRMGRRRSLQNKGGDEYVGNQ